MPSNFSPPLERKISLAGRGLEGAAVFHGRDFFDQSMSVALPLTDVTQRWTPMSGYFMLGRDSKDQWYGSHEHPLHSSEQNASGKVKPRKGESTQYWLVEKTAYSKPPAPSLALTSESSIPFEKNL